MKKAVLSVILACLVLLVEGQQRELRYPFLGQPVYQFKDSILCKDALNLDKTYDDYPACNSYLVTPSSVIYRYATIEFPAVFIFPNEERIVTEISHHRSYLKDGTDNSVKEDEAALTGYFNSLYGSPAKKRVKSQYTDDRYMTWEKEGIKIKLLITKLTKRKDVKLRSVLSLHIEKL